MRKDTKENKAPRVIDPDDYDLSLDIHGDPIRSPPIPASIRKMEEYDAIPEAFRYGFMRKDKPNDYTEYFRALTDYWNLIGKKQEEIDSRLREYRYKDNILFYHLSLVKHLPLQEK